MDSDFFFEIDIHFAELMDRLSGKNSPELFLASALLSHATSEGHVCLDLAALEGRPLELNDGGESAVTCPGLDEWHKGLETCRVVGRPGDFKPIILDDRSRLYLYRYWQYESILAHNLRSRAAQSTEDMNITLLRDGLSRIFETPQSGSNEQQQLAAFMSIVKKFAVISGGPGTGKSSLIARILALILEQAPSTDMRIALAAPTGKAAARLQEAVGSAMERLPLAPRISKAFTHKAYTIHRLLGTIPGSPYFRYNAENPLPVDVVVIDEASMVDMPLMSKLMQATPMDSRLILLGDKDQLASVEAGAVLGDICDPECIHAFSPKFLEDYHEITGETFPSDSVSVNGHSIQDCLVQLKKNYRFAEDSGISRASTAVNNGDGHLALEILKSHEYDDMAWQTLPTPDTLARVLRKKILETYKPFLEITDPGEMFQYFERFRILCAIRRGPYGVSALNLLVEKILAEEHLVDPNRQWYRGRPILIKSNDYQLGLFNGDVGIILPDSSSDNELRAFFMSIDGTLRHFLPMRLPAHETLFAMTVHASQGSEFDRALLVLPDRPSPVITRELIYTAITRAREKVEIWGTEAVFLEGVGRRIQRASGLHDALWGQEKGIDPE